MTTAPLPLSITNKIKARQQSVRWTCILKETRQFRAYCCNINAAGIMGVSKEPVIIASINPNPVCLTADISWDISDSYAPGSTLTTWSIDFGDGVGNASGADFPNDTTSGTYTYGSAGTYTIEITVNEGGGKSQTSEVEIIVVSCGEDGGFDFENWSYLSSYGGGIYFIDWTTVAPAWVSRNTGLEGDALKVNHLVMRPDTKHLSDTNHILLASTDDGLYRTLDGGRSWAKINLPDPSNVEYADTPAATIDELVFKHAEFDPTDLLAFYTLGEKASPGRVWMYKTEDNGINWSSYGIIPP